MGTEGGLKLSDLLARRTRGGVPEISDEGARALAELITWNDAHPDQRFGYDTALKLAKSYGVRWGRVALDKWCAHALQRKSYATK